MHGISVIPQQHLGFRCCPVFISAAYKYAVVTPCAAVPSVAIRTQHATDDVAQVRDVVDVGKSARDLRRSSRPGLALLIQHV